jgi:hypothetical protein
VNETKGYYSLIQYCPDQSRLEAINLGIVVFCPELHVLKARWLTNARPRVRKMFVEQDWRFLDNQINALDSRLSIEPTFAGRDEFVRFSETRANSLQLTAPRPVKVQEPIQVLDTLFNDLVGEKIAKPRAAKVAGRLTRALKSNGLLSVVRPNVEVEIPHLRRTLKASYGYQNGRYNLIQPEQFGLSDEEHVIEKASRVAVAGKFLYEGRDEKLGQLQLVVVGAFKANQQETRRVVGEIFSNNRVNLYTFEQLDPLLADIKANAPKNTSDGFLA